MNIKHTIYTAANKSKHGAAVGGKAAGAGYVKAQKAQVEAAKGHGLDPLAGPKGFFSKLGYPNLDR